MAAANPAKPPTPGKATAAPAGGKAPVAAGKGATAPAKDKAGESAKGRGRKSQYAGKRINIKTTENPCRAGTQRHKEYALMKEGMTFEEYIKVGGTNFNLFNAVVRGNVVMK